MTRHFILGLALLTSPAFAASEESNLRTADCRPTFASANASAAPRRFAVGQPQQRTPRKDKPRDARPKDAPRPCLHLAAA